MRLVAFILLVLAFSVRLSKAISDLNSYDLQCKLLDIYHGMDDETLMRRLYVKSLSYIIGIALCLLAYFG